tara:strand:- start:650 stop:1171 length:522 start_codon:yes stop_codon:yes gene_type:complete
MSLNINGNNSDTAYRYQMPKLKINHTGSGKNCKTVLSNLEKVSESIGCPGTILLAYLSFKCGSNMDKSNSSIKGHYTESNLQNEIFEYINSFVMCSCGIPELIPQVKKKSKKKKSLQLKCSACGKITELKNDKASLKTGDHIIKCLDKDMWTIKSGMIVNTAENTEFDNLFNL